MSNLESSKGEVSLCPPEIGATPEELDAYKEKNADWLKLGTVDRIKYYASELLGKAAELIQA